QRVIGLVAAAWAAAELAGHSRLRGDRSQPIFVGEAEPPGGSLEAFGGALVEVLPIDAVIGLAVEHPDRAGVVLPGRPIARLACPADKPDWPHRQRLAGGVRDALLDREEIAVIDRDPDLVAGSVGGLRGQRHGLAGAQRRSVGGP